MLFRNPDQFKNIEKIWGEKNEIDMKLSRYFCNLIDIGTQKIDNKICQFRKCFMESETQKLVPIISVF